MRRLPPVVLEDLPNVGPSIAANLRRVGIGHPYDLVGQDPVDLYRALCLTTATRQDPCVLDVFLSVIRHVEGAPPRPWWHYTAERKRRYPGLTEDAVGVVDTAINDRARSRPRSSTA